MIVMEETTRRQWEYSGLDCMAAIREEFSPEHREDVYVAAISVKTKYGFRIERKSEPLFSLDDAKAWCEDSIEWARGISKTIKLRATK